MLISLGGVGREETARIAAFIAAYKRYYPVRNANGRNLIPNAKETVELLHLMAALFA
jgi:hypothetical protein